MIIALSRLNQPIYTVFQFIFLYYILQPRDAAPYSLALAAISIVALFDLSLSLNAGSFRLSVGRNSSRIHAILLTSLLAFIFSSLSASLILCFYLAVSSDGKILYPACVFLFSLSLYNSIYAALPIISNLSQYKITLLRAAIIDIIIVVISALAVLTINARYLPATVVSLRTLALIFFIVAISKNSLNRNSLRIGFYWWVRIIRRRISFLLSQTLAVFAGILLFSVPSFVLFKRETSHDFVFYAMSVSIASFITSYVSSYIGARTDVLLRSSQALAQRGTVAGLVVILRFVLPPYALLAIAALASLAILKRLDLGPDLPRGLSDVPLSLVATVLMTGFFSLAAQAAAIGQRLRSHDHFVLPSLLLGALNTVVIAVYGWSSYDVAWIAFGTALLGLTFGLWNTRRKMST